MIFIVRRGGLFIIVCPFGHCIVSFGFVMRGGLFIIVCPFGHCIASFGIVMRGGLFIIVCPFGHCIVSFGIVIVWFVHYCLSFWPLYCVIRYRVVAGLTITYAFSAYHH